MEKKRLYRSKKDRWISGVCGGVAERFGLNVTVVRIVWAALILAYGLGLLLYVIASVAIPQEDDWTRNF